MIDATLDFKPDSLTPENMANYFKKAVPESEFALLVAQNSYQAQLASHKALLDQRDRLTSKTA
ncbi:hypothetical protein V5E97_10215 [Singulisphaera sp. Ch08]|uniref:Uncharacterized protein n=1 Tax=Singulisphaera sp. Ch08 TaxID=3120278 RepID=A0AAU7CN13_9BACT